MQSSITICMCYAALFLGTSISFAQKPETPNMDNSEVVKELEALRKDVQDIKILLQRQQLPLPQGATNVRDPVPLPEAEIVLPYIPTQSIGSLSAKVVVVEFSDLQCPYCTYFQKTAFEDFKRRYVDTGKVRFLSQDFPLDMHPDAMKMSLASICAGEQGKYWEMRAELSKAGSLSNGQVLTDTSGRLQLSQVQFDSCLSSAQKLQSLKTQIEQARMIGISGTPTFLIGMISGDKIPGVLSVGASSAADLGKIIESVITKGSRGRVDAVSKTSEN